MLRVVLLKIVADELAAGGVEAGGAVVVFVVVPLVPPPPQAVNIKTKRLRKYRNIAFPFVE
jgi:hypothetical protein